MLLRNIVTILTYAALNISAHGTATASTPADHSVEEGAFSTTFSVDGTEVPATIFRPYWLPWPIVPPTTLPDCGKLPKQFTPQRPECETSTPQGRFTGQIAYGSSSPYAFQWSFRLNGPTAALAAGPMVENADLFDHGNRVGNYHDHHSGIPSDYLVHSSVGGLTTSGSYELLIEEKFPTANGGQATVTGRFAFVITLV